jgi:putative flavoprotein involved in K+ transport
VSNQFVGTAVIGGSQAGLAVGYYLKQHGVPFVILDENDRVGDAWRNRWDSLRLFTPGRYDGLPGMPFPGSPWAYPTKDQTADYFEMYARRFELPVRTGGELDESIVQLHSKEYRRPSQIQKGAVLIVGAGNSGAEIAMELAPDHKTWLSGPDTGQEPTRAGSRLDHVITPLMWLAATRLTVKTAIGRKLRDRFTDPPRGIPLGRVRRQDFARAGIERVPRITAVRNGFPVLEDGRVLEVPTVIWCTGYAPNYDWIDLSLQTRKGQPLHDRGIVRSCPGLYSMGLLFLYSLSSALVGGVGRDARHIVDHIVSTH